MKRASNVVAEIVLTGGPCGGKTTAMSFLQKKLSEFGYRVIIVPEVATMFITGGVADIGRLAAEEPERYLDVQANLMLCQRDLRERFLKLAASFDNEKVVVLHDRGMMDDRAYMSQEQFDAVLQEARLSLRDVRDSYDAVIHLVTAAKGASEHYTTENNGARQESAEDAIEADERTLQAWVGHPHLRIIGNETDFETKLRRILSAVTHVLGIPEPLEIERKYLLAWPPNLDHPALRAATCVEIEQTYLLTDDDSVRRVRKRSQGGHITYYLTDKVELRPGVREERERIIGPREFLRFLSQADPERKPIRKSRYCFAWKNAYFELDRFHEPDGLWLLEVELAEEGEQPELPEFLSIAREVTEDPAFSNSRLAATLGG